MLALRPYQQEAVDRLVERGSLLLALTMGAGKTATAITAVRQLRRLREVDNGCVFALKSTKGQWVREIRKWDPRASIQVVDGDKESRVLALKRAQRFNYTILHYQCLVNDWEILQQYLPIDFMILDEATAIKGFTSKTSKRAKLLGRDADVRMALSGQPVENRPEELFSIMEFVDPEVLGTFTKFDRTFIERDYWGKPKKYKNLHLIQLRMGEAMYRKSREDIAEWLPDMIEIPMPIVLDGPTMALHDLVRADLSEAIDSALSAGATGGNFNIAAHYGHAQSHDIQMMGQVMSRLLAMRMLSSHPALLKLSADAFDSELSAWGSQYASDLKAAGVLNNLPASTAKLEALLDQVDEILTEDPRHKVVIFSYFKPMLAMIRQALPASLTSVLITGDVSTQDRDKAIVAFNTDPTVRVFLSSDAGAYGISLGQGSHLLSFDLPWSAGALNQRVARIDRTDSAFKEIVIGYMFGQDTIEERMFNMLQQKRKVGRAFLDGDFDPKSAAISLDLESLRQFLDS